MKSIIKILLIFLIITFAIALEEYSMKNFLKESESSVSTNLDLKLHTNNKETNFNTNSNNIEKEVNTKCNSYLNDMMRQNGCDFPKYEDYYKCSNENTGRKGKDRNDRDEAKSKRDRKERQEARVKRDRKDRNCSKVVEKRIDEKPISTSDRFKTIEPKKRVTTERVRPSKKESTERPKRSEKSEIKLKPKIFKEEPGKKKIESIVSKEIFDDKNAKDEDHDRESKEHEGDDKEHKIFNKPIICEKQKIYIPKILLKEIEKKKTSLPIDRFVSLNKYPLDLASSSKNRFLLMTQLSSEIQKINPPEHEEGTIYEKEKE